MEKRGRREKQILIYIFAFIVPALLYAAAWAQNGIIYGGELTPLTNDLLKQFAPNIASLRYVWNGQNSLFYNWANDLGGDYYSLFALSLSSPLNSLTILWDLRELPNAIYILMLIKIGLCGLSFCVFIRYEIRRIDNSWIDIIFCCCYALMSYLFAFGLCIMWIDILVLLPIVLIGVGRLIEGKGSLVYILSLAFLIFVNFYTAISACFYIFLYFLFCISKDNINSNSKKIRLFFRFVTNSIIAALLVMPLILPAILKLFDSIRIEKIYEVEMSFANDGNFPLAFLKMLLPFQYEGIGITAYQLPYIFCGIVSVILCVLFFFSKAKKIEKQAALWLIIPPLLGFVFPFVDYAWHCFQAPHGFLYRYSYVFSLSVLIIAIHYFCKLSFLNKKMNVLLFVFSLITIVELEQNGAFIIHNLNQDDPYETRENYEQTIEIYSRAVKKIQSKEQEKSFYRIAEDIGFEGRNAGLMFGFPGTSYFSSCINVQLNNFMIACGTDSTTRFTNTSGMTSFANSLLGVKYLISSDILAEPYIFISELEEMEFGKKLYENPNIIPGGVLVPRGVDEITADVTGISPVDMNNILMYLVSGNMAFSELTHDFSVEDGEVLIRIPLEQILDDAIYLYIGNMEHDNNSLLTSTVKCGEEVIRLSAEEGKKRVLRIPVARNNDQQDIVIRLDNVDVNRANIIFAFQANPEIEQATLDALNSREMFDVKTTKYGYTGKVRCNDDSLLFLTVANDKGWNIFIDGKQVKTKSVFNVFAAAEVDAGEHFVELRFIPYGFKLGVLLGISGVLLFVYTCNQNRQKED